MEELMNTIYDTLYQNKQYPQFDIDATENQFVDAKEHFIEFSIGKETYQLRLNKIHVSK